ncbi:MAG: HlyD family efflux transporter periplasmic adaptor subunit [Phormidesmis sp.]
MAILIGKVFYIRQREENTVVNNPNTDLLPTARLGDFLPPIGRWTTYGGLLIVATIGLALPFTAIAKYKETVKTQATIRPSGELRIVQAATEGQVIHIAVKENQRIEKGDVLATIDDSRLQTKKSQLLNSVRQAAQQRVQINVQISVLDSQIEAETDRINRAVASAEAQLSQRQRGYRDRQITASAEVQEAEANLQSVKAALMAAQSKRDRYQRVAQQGAISQDQFEEAQLAAQQQEQAVAAAEAKVRNARTALEPSPAEVAIASEQIAQERASGKASLAALNREREALIQQRIQVDEQLERDSRELQQAETDLNQTIITAPANGILFKLNLRNSSQTVQPGDEIAQIAPSDAPLTIKAAVSPQDVGKLEAGQKVQMRVSACPYPDYGTLKGSVRQISGDTTRSQAHETTNRASAQSGNTAFYEVTIGPENLLLGKGKNQCAVQLGMEGRADIVTREETVLKFMLRKARLITDI